MESGERWGTVTRTAEGWIALGRTERGLCRSTLPQGSREEALALLGEGFTLVEEGEDPLLARAADWVRGFLSGEAVDADVPLDLSGVPAFTRAALAACQAIPRGRTVSYADLADRAGNPRAARAAGQTMRRNPLPLFIPCHRVVGSDGRLTGFAGGREGLGLKARLLEMEGAKG